MTRPSDIDQATWDEAERVGEAIHGRHEAGWVNWPLISESGLKPQVIVARAILAAKAEQREADAKIADAETLTGQPPADLTAETIKMVTAAVGATAKSIAASIRKGGQ